VLIKYVDGNDNDDNDDNDDDDDDDVVDSAFKVYRSNTVFYFAAERQDDMAKYEQAFIIRCFGSINFSVDSEFC